MISHDEATRLIDAARAHARGALDADEAIDEDAKVLAPQAHRLAYDGFIAGAQYVRKVLRQQADAEFAALRTEVAKLIEVAEGKLGTPRGMYEERRTGSRTIRED